MQKMAMVGLMVSLGAVGLAGCKGKTEPKEKSANRVADPVPTGSGTGSNVGAAGSNAVAPVQPGSGTATGSAAPIVVDTVTVDAGPAPADPAAVAQCQRIVDKSRTAIAATLAKHEISIPDFEKTYAARSQFGEMCSKLDEPKRQCLEDAASPMAAIGSCKVNDGAASDAVVQAPYVSYDAPVVPLAEGEGAKLLAGLVGTWRNEFVGTVSTWTIGADGKVSITEAPKDGTPRALEYSLSFDTVGRVQVRTTVSSTQTYAFFRIDSKTVLLGNNLAYRINPVANVKKFTLRTQGEWIVVDGAACKVVNDRGIEIAGTCAWGKAGAAKTFKASWDSGRTRQPSGEAIMDSTEYQLVAGQLIDQRLLNIATFKKK